LSGQCLEQGTKLYHPLSKRSAGFLCNRLFTFLKNNSNIMTRDEIPIQLKIPATLVEKLDIIAKQ
jgi:hypothetical protein